MAGDELRHQLELLPCERDSGLRRFDVNRRELMLKGLARMVVEVHDRSPWRAFVFEVVDNEGSEYCTEPRWRLGLRPEELMAFERLCYLLASTKEANEALLPHQPVAEYV